jgi:cysteine desulfurase
VIDLDHNATTPLHPAVRDAMTDLLGRTGLGNPSSVHRAGQAARDVVERARTEVAVSLGAEPLGVTFTSGGTEAAALAILGTARARRAAGRPAGVVSSPIEHPCVLGAVRRLEAEGHAVAWVRPDPHGRIAPPGVLEAIDLAADVGLVSLSAANHELGNAYDVPAIATAIRARAPDVEIHVDAVQAFGKLDVHLQRWGVDLVSVSAHKVHGPPGVGALAHRKTAKLSPLWAGGAQERGRRPGTEPVLLVHGLGVAARLCASELADRSAHVRALRDRLQRGLVALGARIHGDPEHHTGNTINAGLPGCDGQLVAMALDLAGIHVSNGAACSAGTPEPSAVLRALGQPPELAREAIRVSLSSMHTAAHVDALLSALPEIIARVRGAGAA